MAKRWIVKSNAQIMREEIISQAIDSVFTRLGLILIVLTVVYFGLGVIK